MTELNFNNVTPDLFEGADTRVSAVLGGEDIAPNILEELTKYVKKNYILSNIWLGGAAIVTIMFMLLHMLNVISYSITLLIMLILLVHACLVGVFSPLIASKFKVKEQHSFYTGKVLSSNKSRGKYHLNLVKPGTESPILNESVKLTGIRSFDYYNNKPGNTVYVLLTPREYVLIPKSKLEV